MGRYIIKKVLTNNILLALEDERDGEEVFLIGKGIGFSKKTKDIIISSKVDNVFVLKDRYEKKLYSQLLENTSLKIAEISGEVVALIQENISEKLDEHIHIALTDHISFLIRRIKMGIPIENPFALELQALYSKEFEVAKKVVSFLEKEFELSIPEGEVGLITLHIVSSVKGETIEDMQKMSLLISKLVQIIEDSIEIEIDKNSLDYVRLVTHFKFAIERIKRNETIQIPEEMEVILENNYARSFSLAWRIVKVMQQELNATIKKSEVGYIALHLYRFGVEKF
ncbi:PRD domain-containing protein [Enterococcus hulanensis]|uniref:PRD domain-containing protein n=1 Tax=Enterococcus hulanensis TaxID=2559929 RepID=UPI001485BD66|nr:PRD domain-containing protein [Enterococcus hulanensis]MDT2659221.1 PRD domain-containing protein [Enterococcus hulanensis]